MHASEQSTTRRSRASLDRQRVRSRHARLHPGRPDTSYPLLAAALFVVGLGLGSTIMPAMAVGFQAVSREAVGQASSAINTIQRIAASLGIALRAVVLQRAVESELPGVDGGIGALAALSSRE